MPAPKSFLEGSEDIAEDFFRATKKLLPIVARLCLVATFIDDGFRMWTHWNEQAMFFRIRYPDAIVYIIILVNMILQLAGSGMVMARQQVMVAVGMLAFIVLFQTLLYSPLWSWNFFARNLALVGGLILLLADLRVNPKHAYAGVPSMGNEDKSKAVLQLTGRVLTVLMFFTLIHGDMGVVKVMLTMLEFGMLVCVVIGFKTKLAALVMSITLFVFNVFMNNFWSVPQWQYDYVKYDFFQTLSVIGGLLMIVSMGAGDLSLDEKKKEY
eukprot:comp12044_c0_seq1/m.6749 comp12044_c0_seq1/g.6749  ORF comp12044_c0_seq1/g.6749 comp12044_c0_seq1/m.6749 type:complete len:268 (-) comp12044_c0_seq1:173-976(-)